MKRLPACSSSAWLLLSGVAFAHTDGLKQALSCHTAFERQRANVHAESMKELVA